MGQRVLFSGDVDAIKDYVFETSSLPQIRGGSELLLECEEKIREELRKEYGYEVIYCGGGSFLLEVEAEKAETLKRAIEGLYLSTTKAATVTVVYEEVADSPPSPPSSTSGWAERLVQAWQEGASGGDLGRRMVALAARMQEAKMQKASVPFYEALPFGDRCDRCGKRMGVNTDRIEEGKLLCEVCDVRDQRGREEKQRLHDKDIRGQFNQKFWQKWGAACTAKQPEDLDTLVEGASRKYLAFLYADGNGIGQLLQRAETRKEYGALSKALAKGTQKAVYEALWAVCGEALNKEKHWPFDIVNIGGDDVTLILQAGYAWAVGVKFLRQFEEEVTCRLRQAMGDRWPEGWPERITASCGIAIADVHYPMRYFEHLAGDLLKEAKKVAKRNRGSPESAITFLWLSSPVASETAKPLMAFYERHAGQNPRFELTARPYTLHQAEEIGVLVRKVSRWPRSLRHRWAEALEHGVQVSTNTILYDVARRKEKQQEALDVLTQIGKLVTPEGDQNRVPAPIWHRIVKDKEVVWQTAVLDVLELAELEAIRSDVAAEEESE